MIKKVYYEILTDKDLDVDKIEAKGDNWVVEEDIADGTYSIEGVVKDIEIQDEEMTDYNKKIVYIALNIEFKEDITVDQLIDDNVIFFYKQDSNIKMLDTVQYQCEII